MNTRNRTIDTAKAILILLMAFGHTLLIVGVTELPGIYHFIFKQIYAFHMPAFFMISGFLYNTDKWKKRTILEYAIAKFKQVIIPYFFFEFIAAAMKRFFNWGTYDSLLDTLLNILSVQCYVPANWYLIVYFFSSLLFFLLANHCSKHMLTTFSFISISLVGLFPNCLPPEISRILLAASFISFGYIGKNIFLQNYPPLWILLSLVITVSVSVLNPGVVYLNNAIIHNPVYFLIAALTGTFFILQISQRIHSRWLHFIGANTIIILGLHSNINYMISYFTYLIPEFWFIMLMCVFSFALLSIMIPFINRFLPKAVGKWR